MATNKCDVVRVSDGEVVRDALHKGATLIAEAGTVYHETGLTPRQLADALRELIDADRLMDATQAAYNEASAGRIRNDLWDDVLAARKRRKDVLARVGSRS